MVQQTEQTVNVLEDFKMEVNRLSYIVNDIGINNSFDRTIVRNAIDRIEISFNTYIQTLINVK